MNKKLILSLAVLSAAIHTSHAFNPTIAQKAGIAVISLLSMRGIWHGYNAKNVQDPADKVLTSLFNVGKDAGNGLIFIGNTSRMAGDWIKDQSEASLNEIKPKSLTEIVEDIVEAPKVPTSPLTTLTEETLKNTENDDKKDL